MNMALPALLEALRRSLRETVQPELRSDHARSQLAGVLDILGKLERMTDWLPAIEQEEHDALVKGLDAVAKLAAAAHVSLPSGPEPATGNATEACRERLRRLSDWLFEAELAPAIRNEMDALARAALRESIAAQRRRIPRTDFSSMTASSE
jgi:hypothetical protein